MDMQTMMHTSVTTQINDSVSRLGHAQAIKRKDILSQS